MSLCLDIGRLTYWTVSVSAYDSHVRTTYHRKFHMYQHMKIMHYETCYITLCDLMQPVILHCEITCYGTCYITLGHLMQSQSHLTVINNSVYRNDVPYTLFYAILHYLWSF